MLTDTEDVGALSLDGSDPLRNQVIEMYVGIGGIGLSLLPSNVDQELR